VFQANLAEPQGQTDITLLSNGWLNHRMNSLMGWCLRMGDGRVQMLALEDTSDQHHTGQILAGAHPHRPFTTHADVSWLLRLHAPTYDVLLLKCTSCLADAEMMREIIHAVSRGDPSKVSFVVTDNAANMVAARRLLFAMPNHG
jgi:hypothetical protein